MSTQTPQLSNEEFESYRQQHKETFESWLNELQKDSTSKIIDRARSETILNVIQGRSENVDSNFKHFVKRVNFNVVTEEGKSVLFRPIGDKNLPVAIKEDFFDIL